MPEYEEEGAKLRREMGQKAISLAMQSRWQEAIAVNQSIIEAMPADVNAYNRLGRAFMETGDYKRAKESYKAALELAPGNTIARKNLERLSQLSETQATTGSGTHGLAPHLFVNEVGKTGVVELYHLAAREVVAKMVSGAPVYLKVEGRQLVAENGQGEYLGVVASQHGSRLVKMIEEGNKYAAAVVSLDDRRVKIIIREVFQHPSQVGRLSFPVKSDEGFRTHVRDTLLRYGAEDEGLEEIEYPDSGEDAEEFLPEGFSILETASPGEAEEIDDEFMREE